MRTQLVTVSLLAAIYAVTARETIGFASKNRVHLDSWSDAIYIPNLETQLNAGFIESYSLYARRAGTIILQVWRHVSGSEYKLITQAEHEVKAAGEQEVFPSQLTHVEKGDVLGFYFPKQSIIPFDGHECHDNRGLYVRSPKREEVVVGKTFKFSSMQAGWNPCRQYSFSAVVIPDEGTVAGFESKDRKFLDTWSNAMYIPNVHAVVPDGILSEYSFYARRAGKIILQVFRHHSDTSYELISQTPFNVPSAGVHVVEPNELVAVHDGDVLGFFFPGHSIIPFDGHECADNPGLYVQAPHEPSVVPGKVFKFRHMQKGWNPCRQYSFSALVLKGEWADEGFAAKDRKFLDTWSNSIYIPHAHKPLPEGILTSYTLFARRAGTIILQVWRHVSGDTFELVEQTSHDVTGKGIHEVHPAELVPIEEGDHLGFYFPGQSIIPFDGHECANERGLYVQHPTRSSVTVGKHFKFRNMQAGWNPCREYALTAEMLKLE